MRDQRRPHSPDTGNLPLDLTTFVGRSAELAELAGALGAARLVTVAGPGGVGKSRLAAHAAARCAPRDGVWHVELEPVRDPEFVGYAVVEALGLTDHTTRLPHETLLAHLAGRELLLILDGFEHLVEACAELVTELLRRVPGLTVLGVGRRPMGDGGAPGSSEAESWGRASGCYRWRRWARTRPWSCSWRGRHSTGWPCGTTRTYGRCAGAWTGSRSRSNWPRGGCGCCRRGSCWSGSTTGSGC